MRRFMGTVVLVMGTTAMLGNYFWLVGAVPEPSSDLMTARWVYGVISYFVGLVILTAPL